MPTRTVDIHDAQPPLSDLLQLMSSGDEVLIVEGDTPLARLVLLADSAARARGKRVPGLNRGAIRVSDHFDEPLPDEFWTGGV